MTDIYAHWRARFKTGAELGAPDLPYLPGTNHDTPQPGIYRVRVHKDGPFVPLQVWLVDATGAVSHTWTDGLEIRGTINGEMATLGLIEQRWHWAKPVTKAALAHYTAHGCWEDDAPGIGDNSGTLEPVDELKDYIEQAANWIAGRVIADAMAAEQAGNMAGHLSTLRTKVDKERDAKVRPHLDAQREINAHYKPVIEAAERVARDIKRAIDSFLIAEQRRLEAERRAAYEAEMKRQAEERRRIEAERAAKMEADPVAAMTEPEPELPVAPPPPEPVKVSVGGARGRKISLRTYTIHEITDIDAVFGFFRDHADVRDTLQKLVNAACKAGIKVPGVATKQEERAA